MRSFALILVSLFSSLSFAVAKPTMEISKDMLVIPTEALSCLAQKIGQTTPDIPAAHFALKDMKIKNPTNETLQLGLVTLSYSKDGVIYQCAFGGMSLRASGLVSVAPNSTGAINCPFHCGGVNADKPGTYAAHVEVQGYLEDSVTPVDIEATANLIIR